MSFDDWRILKQKIGMGEEIGRLEEFEFLKETACVHVEQREIIAWCEIYIMLHPEKKKFNEALKTVIIPAFKKLGRARWFRDVLTDLSLGLSAKERKAKKHDSKDVLRV